jgi:tripartite-type tricarboxylate transporter receptor subunit TctC
LVHVPYRGEGPALTDLIGGQVQLLFSTPTGSFEHLRSGTIRALGVTAASRFPLLPDLPAIAETIPGYEATAFGGVAAPRGTPTEIVAVLSREINSGLTDPRIKARFTEVATTLLPMSSEEFGAYVGSEVEKWGKVVKFSGARPE